MIFGYGIWIKRQFFSFFFSEDALYFKAIFYFSFYTTNIFQGKQMIQTSRDFYFEIFGSIILRISYTQS